MAPLSFSDQAVFPAFQQLPTTTEDAPDADWWLLALVKENMTITSPTLVVGDRSGEDFAVVFEQTTLDLKPWKKGSLLVLPRARRTERGEEKRKAVVRVPAGEEKTAGVVYGGWDVLRLWEERSSSDDGVVKCGAGECEKEGVAKCMGCGVVKYCGKVSFFMSYSSGSLLDFLL